MTSTDLSNPVSFKKIISGILCNSLIAANIFSDLLGSRCRWFLFLGFSIQLREEDLIGICKSRDAARFRAKVFMRILGAMELDFSTR